jgi:hypothetical protein
VWRNLLDSGPLHRKTIPVQCTNTQIWVQAA